MSEQEIIGQRIRERLLASGLLSAVVIDHQEKSIILTLVPQSAYTISERIMRFCVNFFGERKPLPRRHELFPWCAAFAEFPGNQTCRVWVDCAFYCGYKGFDVLSELLLVGLKLSASLPPLREGITVYRVENLVQIYRTKEEVLAFYEFLVTQVIRNEEDLPFKICGPTLHPRWTCCFKHRWLFVQRLMIAGWLHHVLDPLEFDEEYDALSDTNYLVHPPQVKKMQEYLLHLLLQQNFSPQEWVQEYFTYATQFEQEHWERPIKSLCQRKHHVSHCCCQFHVAISAIWKLFSTWLEHFNDCYRMRSYVDEKGYSPKFGTVPHIALLICLAEVDTQGMPFPKWYESASSFDFTKYRYQKTNER